jgi:hypothetical protein
MQSSDMTGIILLFQDNKIRGSVCIYALSEFV